MVELVSAKTDLRRAGSRWQGLCPFHDERTPSFSINPEDKLYYCFGCQKGGDAIGFVQEVEGLDFQEAVETLAERYNVRLEREDEDPEADRKRRERERLLGLLDRTARFYASYLQSSEEAAKARAYLAERGFTDEVLSEFRVGYSPSAWDRVLTGAQRDGYSPQELLDSGLAQRNQSGNLYDRFRGRIMFPLADLRGRVLGFGARAMGEGRGPKYLNSSESRIYQEGPPAVRHRRGALACHEVRADRGGRGLHGRAGHASGRDRRDRRDHGHRPHRGPGGGAGEGREARYPRPRRRPGRAGGDAARRQAGFGPGPRARRRGAAGGRRSRGGAAKRRIRGDERASGPCQRHDRVSGPPGTCRCRA